jgi:arylsulfatase A-like enzyme
MQADRPNFLFIITDQQRADHLGCATNPIVKTSNIDSLAARGTRFDRFYSASPLCMPNRATLVTGRMPSAHGVRGNGIPLDRRTTTMMALLRAAGYKTALVGKCHLQNMMPDAAIEQRPPVDDAHSPPPSHLTAATMPARSNSGYDQEWAVNWVENPDHDIKLPYYDFEHVDLCINHGDEVHGHYGRWLEEQYSGSDALRGPENAISEQIVAPEAWHTQIPEAFYPTSYVASKTIEYLEHHAADRASQPFFLQCSFPDPHHPFTPPGKYWGMYDPDDIPLPPSFHQAIEDAPPHVAYVRDLLERGQRDIDVGFAYAVTADEARQAIALTYGMITMIDDAIGRILQRLETLGLARNTIIVFMSDHGDFMGDHRLLLKGPVHYQGLIRVPFIWVDPMAERQLAVCDQLCSSLDFVPTVLDRAGLQPFYGIQGKSLLALIAGDNGSIHDSVLIEEENQRILFGFDGSPRIRSLVTKAWRISIYDRVEWGELYDLRHDPHEMRNLWDDSDYLNVKCEMLELLARKMTVLADRHPFPSGRA